ncbi:MFS transporter [Crassaminicella profunda]|uniref:MFS transporter n=1 Tax=Crassaminicella profunda TaxID=1286698 RepID=UPI001CA73EBA|nr:MFS transporter [Crassaminicella profunda]QZY55638.1 MFS transporter [Crassaminicella profunda]
MNKKTTFAIVTMLYWFSLYTYVPTLPSYAASLGASYKAIGLIVGSYGLSQMIVRIPLGILSDHLNKRKIFIPLGLLLSLLSSLGFLMSSSIPSLFFYRIMAGLSAATWVIYTILFSSYFPKEEAPKAMGLINSFNFIGQLSAMFLGGVVVEKFGVSSAFILSLGAAILGILFSFNIYEEPKISNTTITTSDLIAVSKNSYLMGISVLAILFQLINFSTVFGFTPIVAEKIGATDFQLGLLGTLSILPGVFAAPLSGTFFTKRFGEKRTIIGGFIVTALSTFCIPLISTVPLLMFSQIIGGFSRGLVFPLLMGLSIKDIEESKRATAMGFFQAIYGFGMFLGPFFTGILSDFSGLKFSFYFLGFLGLLSATLSKKLIKY